MPNTNDGFNVPLDQPQAQPAQAPQPQPITRKYAPYVLPTRVGIIDNDTQGPYVEAGDVNEVVLAVLSDILNRLDRIEQSL